MIAPEQALPLWGLEGAKITLVAARENAVYRVTHPSGTYALRAHRMGYRTDTQLAAELDWMAWLDRSGLSVPAPIASIEGPHLQRVDGVQIDLLTWLSGETLDTALLSLDPNARRDLFKRLGQTMAKLHGASDHWPQATSCDRPSWDIDGLLGETPLWDRFWDNPALTSNQRSHLTEFRGKATDDLSALQPRLDYGLIHADLVPGNVMWSGDGLHLIDFDDGGYGFRLFEIATALFKHRNNPDYPALHAALIHGYTANRTIDLGTLPLFLALRAVTYVGWNITRIDEDKTGERNARFVANAMALTTEYLDARRP